VARLRDPERDHDLDPEEGGRRSSSPDSRAHVLEFTDSSDTNAAPVTGKGTSVRVAPGPAGSHATSGSWRTSKMDSISDTSFRLDVPSRLVTRNQ
jgi:hypothetical protein